MTGGLQAMMVAIKAVGGADPAFREAFDAALDETRRDPGTAMEITPDDFLRLFAADCLMLPMNRELLPGFETTPQPLAARLRRLRKLLRDAAAKTRRI